MSTVYMNLTLPVVTETPGPEWASLLNDALTLVDAHDHSDDKGTAVTPAGLNINTDLEFNDNDATELRSTRYTDHLAVLNEVADITCVYVSNGDLYYNNEAGTAVQITSGAGINASSIGGIGGDFATSSAAVTYSNTSKAFRFTQQSGINAYLDVSNISIRESVASANAVTIKSPTSLGASYNWIFPTALPSSGQTKFLTIDSSGQVGDQYDVDGSTLEVSSNSIQVKDIGITRAKMATGAVPKLSVASKTTTYTATSSDDLILCSTAAGNWTLTLYTAVGNSGRVLQIKKTSEDFYTLTIDGNGSETIDGDFTTTLNTLNETIYLVSDGTNWQISDRRIPSVWKATVSQTTTWTSNTSVTSFWRRVGDSLEMNVLVICLNVPSATTFRALFPVLGTSFLTVDTSKLGYASAQLIVSGTGVTRDASTFSNRVCMPSYSSLFNGVELLSVEDEGVVAFNYPFTWTTSDYLQVNFSVPISGWKG